MGQDATLQALLQLPSDYFVQQEAFTAKTHRHEYDAINPAAAALSQAGNTVLITGASQGIGRVMMPLALATQFALARPATLILASRNLENLHESASLAQKSAPETKVITLPCDVTSETSVEQLFAQLPKHGVTRVHVLVNNAGVSVGHTTVDGMDLSEWRKNFDVNVFGTLLMTRHFLRLLGNEHRGTIINISSSAAWNLPEMSAGYCMSKLAVVKLCQQMAERKNVVVTALHPGMVATDIVPSFMHNFALDPPELPASTAVWLASEQAAFMTGRYMSANWCVEELVRRKEEILDKNLCVISLKGVN